MYLLIASKLFAQSTFSGFNQFGEVCRLFQSNISKDFSVEFNAGFVKPADKSRISHVMQTGCGVDALNPQRTEVSLFGSSVAVSILQCFLDFLNGNSENVFIAAPVTFGHVQNFFVACVSNYASFNARHLTILLQIR